jgi:hypothetical protein
MKVIFLGFTTMTAMFVYATFWGFQSTFAKIWHLFIFLLFVAIMCAHWILDGQGDSVS